MMPYKTVHIFQRFILTALPCRRCRQNSASAPRPRYQNKTFYHRKLGYATAVSPFKYAEFQKM